MSRCADNIFIIYDVMDHATLLLSPNITFTMKYQRDNQIDVLDLDVRRKYDESLEKSIC